MRTTSITSRRTTAAASTAAAVVAAVALASTGVSLWPLVVVVATTWWIALGPWVGRLTALGLVAPGSLVLLLAILVMTAATGLPAFATLVAVWSIVGAAGCVVLGRSRLVTPDDTTVDPAPLWVPALLGPVIWIAAAATGATETSTGRLTWVMLGDSVTNLLYARSIVDVGGVALGPQENPVPLPSALIAVSGWAGRSRTDSADLLQHDLTGFLVVWSLLIAATCFTAGLAAAVTVSARHPRLAALSGALASTLPLVWFVSGYSIEYGFFNAHLVLPVLLLCWSVATGPTRSPEAVLLALMLATSVLLTTWTPLVSVPVALGLVIAARRRRELWATRPRRVALGLGASQAVAIAALVAAPALRGRGSTLALDGWVYPLSPWAVVAVLCAAVALTVVAAVKGDSIAWSSGAMVLACAVGVGVLLQANAGRETVWNYYPLKFAWLCCVVALVVLGALTVRLLASGGRKTVAAVACGAIAATAAAGLPQTARALGDRPTTNPVLWAMSGSRLSGDLPVDQVLEGSDASHPLIRWSSGTQDGPDAGREADREATATFWTLQMLSGYPSPDVPLYRLSSTYRPGRIEDLCEITRLVRPPVTIRTRDTGLASRLNRACPGHTGRVIVAPPA